MLTAGVLSASLHAVAAQTQTEQRQIQEYQPNWETVQIDQSVISQPGIQFQDYLQQLNSRSVKPGSSVDCPPRLSQQLCQPRSADRLSFNQHVKHSLVQVTARSDGRLAFNSPPRLVESATTVQNSGGITSYQFTIHVPQDAGQSLKALEINQVPNLETVEFIPSQSRAVVADGGTRGLEVKLSSIGGDQAVPGETMVVFDPPIYPGMTVTVFVQPKRNPRYENIYMFGVVAYPEGENTLGQFLGYGRLSVQP
jgi:hypothetical protein